MQAATLSMIRVCSACCRSDDGAAPSGGQPRSISSLTTEEWRTRYERDGAVDLWVEEEFNSGSRLTVRCHRAPCLGLHEDQARAAGSEQRCHAAR